VRISVRDFVARGSLAQNARRNAALAVQVVTPPMGGAECFSLFARYQNVRHPGGGMDRMSPREFEGLMTSSPIDTFCAEFRDADGVLVGVMLADVISDGLSAVYSFFAPERTHAGLGTYMVLWLVEHARTRGLDYVYLGYWIARSPKMAYKARFRPLEALHPSDGWIPFEPTTQS
jgi:arginine-tRNA-protein transferase